MRERKPGDVYARGGVPCVAREGGPGSAPTTDELRAAKDEGIREAWAWCARVAGLRAMMWTEADDRRSQDFRDGVTQACEDLAHRFLAAVKATEPADTPTVITSD